MIEKNNEADIWKGAIPYGPYETNKAKVKKLIRGFKNNTKTLLPLRSTVH